MKSNEVYCGDCLDLIKELGDESIDLIFTSPPYADRRKATYGGVQEDKYVEWFLPIAHELKRVLSKTGSFFLNIKPHTNKGERSLYVFDLICQLKRKTGFKFVDEFCWTKNAFPGDHRGRFKNAFEPIFHFTKASPSDIKFNPIACGTPIKQETTARAFRKQCGDPKNGSGMTGMNTQNLRELKIARPSNVVHAHNVSNQFSDKQLHPATFPEQLVEFFVKSFTDEHDVVLDPFGGSGTTALVAERLGRNFILMDKEQSYCDLANKRIKNLKAQIRRKEPFAHNKFFT